MAVISQQTTATTGQTLTAAIWNDEFANIIDDYNGNITNANIAASAGIAYTKLTLTGAVVNADLAGSIDASKISDTALTQTATQTASNKTLTKPTVNASVNPITTNSDGATVTFSMATSNHHKVTIAANRVFAVSSVTSGQAFLIHVKQDGGGNRTVTWWGSILWSGGSAPSLTATGGKTDTFGFIYDGSNYYGYVIGTNI